MPAIAGVGLTLTRHHAEGLVLAGAATDRFRAGMAYTPTHETHGGLDENFLELDQLKETLARLKGARGPVWLESDAGKLVIIQAPADRLVLDTPDLFGFPRIAPLLRNPGHDTDHRDVPARVTARYLEAFTAITKRRGEYLRAHRRPDAQMITVFIGDTYREVLMAIRPVEEAGPECPVFDIPAPQAPAAA